MMDMTLNRPEVVAEVSAAFERYEQALIDKDVDVLDASFWDSPHTVRYAVRENGYGFDAIHAARVAAVPIPGGSKERRIRVAILTVGTDLATVNYEYIARNTGGRTGRQSQTWLRIPGRAAASFPPTYRSCRQTTREKATVPCMDDVELLPYDPAWPALYAAEARRVLAALPPGLVLAMEHFGSTAIPGMVAKPVIDILVAVRSVETASALAAGPMEALGYAFWADNPRRDRLFFVRGLPPAPRRTHHVHMTQPEGELWRRLLFRDHLRAHLEEAARYAALKRSLAARHANDREAYTAGKSAYVDAVMALAGTATRSPARETGRARG